MNADIRGLVANCPSDLHHAPSKCLRLHENGWPASFASAPPDDLRPIARIALRYGRFAIQAKCVSDVRRASKPIYSRSDPPASFPSAILSGSPASAANASSARCQKEMYHAWTVTLATAAFGCEETKAWRTWNHDPPAIPANARRDAPEATIATYHFHGNWANPASGPTHVLVAKVPSRPDRDPPATSSKPGSRVPEANSATGVLNDPAAIFPSGGFGA